MKLTPQQESIISAVRAGSNLLVEARAGCGKTSTITLASKQTYEAHPLKTQLLLAFNVKAKDELAARLGDQPNVQVKTLNGLGHAAWAKGRRLTVNGGKLRMLLDDICEKEGLAFKYQEKRAICSLVDAARVHGLAWDFTIKDSDGIKRSYSAAPIMEDTPANWDYLWAWTECESKDEATIRKIARDLLELSTHRGHSGFVDFTDQLYLPTIFGGNWPKSDLVLIDEAQDLSPLNHKMIRLLPCKQLVAVGDPAQSIYGFRGAVSNSMDQLRTTLEKKGPTLVLPLSVTFRCGKAIVERQKPLVPNYTAHESNPSGQVFHWPEEQKEEWSLDSIPPEDSAILCRNNAPLFSMACRLLGAGLKVTILGREFAEGLKKDIDAAAKGSLSMPLSQLAPALTLLYNSRLKRDPSAAQLALVDDKTSAVAALLQNNTQLRTTKDLITFLGDLYESDPKNPGITLSTGHKAKGLEWDWVLHLNPELIPSKYAKDADSLLQESNLRYVIETRPRHTLVLASLKDLES